jgi:plasmid stability protein
MDKTIRNLDPKSYRTAKARAAAEGRTVGEVVNEALAAYLARPTRQGQGSLADWHPQDLGAGTETLSQDVDQITYGA